MKKLFFVLFISIIMPSLIYAAPLDDGKIPSFNVEVENPIFSPIAHMKEGVVFLPVVNNIKRIKEWVLTVKNEYGKDIAVFLGKREIPKRIVWDAKGTDGNPVADGKYTFEFILDASDEVYVFDGSQIMIDSTSPHAEMRLIDDVYFLDRQKQKLVNDININIKCSDENGIDYSRSFLNVLNFNGKEVKTFHFQNDFPESLYWDGVDDTYNIPLPAGDYKVNFTVFDIAGNSSQVSANFLIVTLAQPQKADETEIDINIKEKEQNLPPKAAVEKSAEKAAEKNESINFPLKIFFESAKNQLSNENKEELKKAADFLKKDKKYKIKIAGYTDVLSEEGEIKNIAANRAVAVKKFLIEAGIPVSRMRVLWYPAPKKANEKNRRVDISIIKE
ncbi:MAG: OmpA family protein [Elusimicrobiota bacterium]|jgi:outer membrane protein OmpA-like peptidoglycan-associated protein|nr:OmpA family protein [Elusimicrobiota bacterium]